MSYLGITKYIILFTAFTQVCTAFYNGRGNTKPSLKGFLIELPINAVLSYFLIFAIGAFSGLDLVAASWGSLVAVFLRNSYFRIVLAFDTSIVLSYPRERSLGREMRIQLKEFSPIAANFFVLIIGVSFCQLLYSQLDVSSFVAITLIFPGCGLVPSLFRLGQRHRESILVRP